MKKKSSFFSNITKHKLQVIDIFALFLLVAAIVGGFVWFTRPKGIVRVELTAPIVDGKSALQPYWLSNAIHIGDPVYDAFGNEVARVVDVKNVDFGGIYRSMKITVDLKVIKDTKVQVYQFENQNLALGSALSFVIHNAKFSGVVEHIIDDQSKNVTDQRSSVRKQFFVHLLVQNVFPWQIKTYTPDFVVYDSDQHDIFHIVKITGMQDSPPQLIPNTQVLTWNTNSQLKDVEMTVLLEADCQNGVCYYNEEQPLKIGSNLRVESNQSVISQAQIMEMKDAGSTSSGELWK